MGRARRSGDRRRRHPQPAGLHGRPRHRPRPRRRRARHAEAGRGRPTIAGAFPCPVEIRTDDPEGCPAFYGRVDPRRPQRPLAGLAAAAAEGGRPAADQRPGRHDQLRHAELRPAAPRLRPRQASRARSSPAAPATARRCWRSTARPTGSTRAMTVIADDRRRARYRRHHGRRAFGRHRGDHRHPDRMRLFRSRAHIARPARSWR